MTKRANIAEVVALQRLNDAIAADDRESARLWWLWLSAEHPEVIKECRKGLPQKTLAWLDLKL